MRRFAAGLFCLLAAGVGPAGATPAQRQLLVLNRGSATIFSIRVGHAGTQSWSEDLLPFNDVLPVGEGKEVSVNLRDGCLYDIRATYRDKSSAEIAGVDICTAESVSFDR